MNNNIFNNKKVIAFDLDGTLAESKSPINPKMSEVLSKLLKKYKIAIISGGSYTQFKKQVIDTFTNDESDFFSNLILFPTTGSSLYVYKDNQWICEYEELLNQEDKDKIVAAWEKSIKETNTILPTPSYGQVIEDRGTQMSFSACGQDAPFSVKSTWDPDQEKRKKVRDVMLPLIPEFSINFGGTNTIDVTRSGVDKEYAINKLISYLDINKSDIIFMGDKLQIGGNDHPAVNSGVDCISVSNPNDTINVLIKLI
ncbi:MAG: HAD-IIB family hydrolase [Candidatus Nomurabacteria bacterium]|nr:HAD-IIB family hydrolase [Candidatus Nomurabacteria bacterium]